MHINELIDRLYQAKELGTNQKTLEDEIFKYISQDEKIIPSLLAILAYERADTKAYISELNEAASIGLATLDAFPGDKDMNANAILKMKMFYHKWEHRISCSFKLPGLK